MKIGIIWWQSPLTERHCIDVENSERAMKELGIETEFFVPKDIFPHHAGHMELAPDEGRLDALNDCDMVWTGIYDIVLNEEARKKIEPPIHFQIDGIGTTSFHDDWVNPKLHKLTEVCDLVTCLDLNVYEVFQASNQKFDYSKLFFIPNATEDLPETIVPYKFEKGVKTIGSLMGENRYKQPWHFLDAVRALPEEVELIYPIGDWDSFLAGEPRYKLPPGTKTIYDAERTPNMIFTPYMSRDKIASFISGCDIFAHYSSADAFAKTITEAFSVGVAPVVSDVVRAQGISIKFLDTTKEMIGKPLETAHQTLKKYFRTGNGEHILILPKDQPELCARVMSEILANQKEYKEKGLNAKDWNDNWITWADKWRLTVELAQEQGLV